MAGKEIEKNEIDHINCNKLDNRLENLEWVTKTNSKINEKITIAIYNDYHKNKLIQKQRWGKYNTTKSLVGKIVLKQRWKHIHKD